MPKITKFYFVTKIKPVSSSRLANNSSLVRIKPKIQLLSNHNLHETVSFRIRRHICMGCTLPQHFLQVLPRKYLFQDGYQRKRAFGKANSFPFRATHLSPNSHVLPFLNINTLCYSSVRENYQVLVAASISWEGI